MNNYKNEIELKEVRLNELEKECIKLEEEINQLKKESIKQHLEYEHSREYIPCDNKEYNLQVSIIGWYDYMYNNKKARQ